MKRYSSLLLATLLAGPTAFASLNFDFREDYRSVNYNDDAATKNFSTFNMKTARLDYQGKLSDEISFRARVALNKDGNNASGTNESGLQKAVEYAYVANKLSESFTLTAGRYASDIGAFEGLTAGPDLYMTSSGYSGSGAIAATVSTTRATATKLTASNTYLYLTGAKISYKMDTNEFVLMAANPVNVITTGTDTAQNRLMTGFVYKGGFMDKSLNLVASYHSVGLASTTTPTKDENLEFIGLGVTYAFANNVIGMDNLMNTYKLNPTATTSATNKSTTMNVTYAYKGLETLTPMVKYFQTSDTPDSTIVSATVDKVVVTGTSAVLEYKPIKDQTVRYHVAYSNYSDKTSATSLTTTPAQTEILLGMRVNADFLK